MDDAIRLPLDLLLTHDVDDLENALTATFAVEFEHEIYFCHSQDDLNGLLEDFGDDARWYAIDDIELDRVEAIIELLNKAEDDRFLGRLLDRIVR